MNNITISEYIDPITKNVTEYVTIDKGNNEFTFMTKEHWDKLEAEREQSGTL